MKYLLLSGFLSISLALNCAQAEDPAAHETQWGARVSLQEYLLPGEDDLTTPVISVTHGDLLIEGRFNYEGRDVGSLWLGKSYAFGDTWEFEFAPMIGGFFDYQHGMAPGLKADIYWKSFNFYSELEYAFSFDTREDNFFYSWSELTYGLFETLRIGLVGNRTRSYDSAAELDRGPIIKAELGSLTAYFAALNLDSNAIYVLGIEASLGNEG